MRSLLVTVLFFAFVSTSQAQAVKRIYLANDDHTDYMWTGNEAQYDTAFVRMLDYYLRQIDSTAGRPGKKHPDNYQARWNCDGSYWLRTYQKFRSPAQFDKLIGYLKSGHISSPLNSLVSTYGAQPTEAVLRGMYYAGQLERQYGLRFPMAVCMENQTLPLGLSSLWAGSGAQYSWRGVCNCASKIGNRLSVRKHQLYRYVGLDNRSVLMKWYNRHPQSVDIGGYAETRTEPKVKNPIPDISSRVAVLEAMCDTLSLHSAYPYNVAAAFGYGWDDLETYNAPAFIAAAQQTTTPTRWVRVSNEEDFFRDIERTYPHLPAQSVTFGNEWDLYCASMNETTAQVRRATERLRSAESLATLVSLKKPGFANELKGAKTMAWDAFGLYWEHNWTADGPVTRNERAAWQIKQKDYITRYVDTLLIKARLALGNMLPSVAKTRFYAYNPLGFRRSDAADFAYQDPLPVRVIDLATNKEVASQLVTKSGQRFIRIWAENIPAVGYKVFEVQAGKPSPFRKAVSYANGFIQNPFYRVHLRKSGVITELFDLKANNRQVVRREKGRYLNDLGTTDLDSGELVVENEGLVSVTVRATSTSPLPHVVKVTLYRNSSRIDVEDQITANFGEVKAWSFSLGLNNPTTRYEELGAILTARKETNGGHYAADNARYDYQTFNHFADLSERNYGLTISNQDCSFFQLGQSTADSLWEDSPQLNALAGGQPDPKLGIYDQNGETDFHYSFALTTHQSAFDPVAAMKFSLEHQNPLVTSAITGTSNEYPDTSYSFLQISDPGVLLWSLKPAEEGIQSGVIVRFWNVRNAAVTPAIQLAQSIRQAWQTTHIETNERILSPADGRLLMNFGPFQLNTYRLQLQR